MKYERINKKNMRSSKLKTEIIQKFGTPCAVVDLKVVEQNIKRAQTLCDDAGVKNRPHIKTHKSPFFAEMQIAAGAQGITCQKLGEAEIMVNNGITDIIVATNLIGAARYGRLASLQKRVSLKVCGDNLFSMAAYSESAKKAKRPMDVLIECDTGQKRAGVETPFEALKLVQVIKNDPMLNFAGMLFYPTKNSWPQTQVFYDEMLRGLNSLRCEPGIVSTGGTPNFSNIGTLKGATEHRAGTCIFNDRMMMSDGFATLENCAFSVYSSVVSRGGAERGIIDAGSKTLTSDTGGLQGFGLILEHPDAEIRKFAEEHGFLDLSMSASKPLVGDILTVIPNHVCVVVNMFDKLVAVRDGQIVDVIPIEARGMLV